MINFKNKLTETLLLFSCRHKYLGWLTRSMVLLDTNPNCRDTLGNTPLLLACEHGLEDTAKLLLSQHADPNVMNLERCTPLYFALENNFSEIVPSLINSRDRNGNTPLIRAFKDSRIRFIRSLLLRGANITIRDLRGHSALYWCVHNNLLNNLTAKLLVENYSDIALAAACKEKLEPLALALLNNNANPNIFIGSQHILSYTLRTFSTNMVYTLINRGVDINILDESGDTPLLYAIKHNLIDITKFLIDNGANLNRFDLAGNTPLMHAILQNNIPLALHLIERGANVNAKNFLGITALMYACQYELIDVTKILIPKVDINAKDRDGRTAIMYTLKNTSTDIFECLCEHCANIDAMDRFGNTLLMYTIQQNNTTMAKLLIKLGANINTINHMGFTPIMYACMYKAIDIAKELIACNANINIVDHSGFSPLMYACQFRLSNIAKKLISCGANVNAKTNTGTTPLILACKYQLVEVVSKLISKKADVNCMDDFGGSPLIYACSRSGKASYDIAMLLIANNALINISDENNVTPLMYACSNNSTDLLLELINHNAQINVSDRLGNTPLMYALKSGFVEGIEKLVTNKADVHIVDEFGNTPLMFVCKENLNLTKLLLKHKADVNAKNYYSETALILACKHSNPGIVSTLLKHGANPDDLDKENRSLLECVCTKPYSESRVAIAKSLIDYGADIYPLLLSNRSLTKLSNTMFLKIAKYFVTVNLSANLGSFIAYTNNAKSSDFDTSMALYKFYRLTRTIQDLRKFANLKRITSDPLFEMLDDYEHLVNKRFSYLLASSIIPRHKRSVQTADIPNVSKLMSTKFLNAKRLLY